MPVERVEPTSTQSSPFEGAPPPESLGFHVRVTVIVCPGVTVLSFGPADVDFTSDPVAAPSNAPLQEWPVTMVAAEMSPGAGLSASRVQPASQLTVPAPLV